ncbi:PstS family phosphate ABC transporter substrate-binding protein [Biostraticola tofi]|uniref:Phosphate-binding protein n=1 Tax=Biostraticola tofi TaxID=466109 RepID=A0A4R3YST3_9GAMM|nr:phosphate ABC transporter substrate-binding protein [Biostraticola tofi]TCV94354.1 phosphate ABC transporter substrate-binding protein (PhoT family) [Biostraticola tofi]
MKPAKRFTAGLLMLALTAFAAPAQPVPALSGNLTSTGSDTLANLMTLWARAFSKQYPEVSVQIQAAGSVTAATALATGTAQLGAMSRPMTPAETQAFIGHYGYPPLAVPVALDALVIVVNQANPLTSITLDQLDAVYSITRACGQGAAIKNWGDLGLQGEWAKRHLVRYGRNSASGTYGFFRQHALCGGDMLPVVNELPGSASVAQSVGALINAIGYASMGFHQSGIKTLTLTDRQGNAFRPEDAGSGEGRYPFARFLYLYINKPPGKPLEPITAAFLNEVLSAKGQQTVHDSGYLPLPERVRTQTRLTLEL